MCKRLLSFHLEKRETLLLVLLFIAISLFLNIVFIAYTNEECAQLNSLFHSNYDYAAVLHEPIDEDSYYRFDAGIDFALSLNSLTRLNADIVMQSDSSVYTSIVCWNVKHLMLHGVAISKNLAKSYGLKEGDKLYSKHIVQNEICEYTVEQILPEISYVSLSKNDVRTNGIIIMGCDELYISNISHSAVVFSQETTSKNEIFGKADSIIFREDEIYASLRRIMPYALAVGLIQIAITIVLALFITKDILHNFKRMMILGYTRKQLNQSYLSHIHGLGLLSFLWILILSTLVFIFIDPSLIRMLIFIFAFLFQCFSLTFTSFFLNWRLWRK